MRRLHSMIGEMTISQNFSVDPFLDREQKKGYNCLDFVREVWEAMTGDDITRRLQGLAHAFSEGKTPISAIRRFERLEQPQSPCLAVMQRYKFVPHIGIYLEGRILHLTDRGVQFQPWIVARQYFVSVKYYR